MSLFMLFILCLSCPFSDQLGTTVAVRLITTFGDIQVSSPQAREQTTNHTFGVCNRESVYASVGMQVLI